MKKADVILVALLEILTLTCPDINTLRLLVTCGFLLHVSFRCLRHGCHLDPFPFSLLFNLLIKGCQLWTFGWGRWFRDSNRPADEQIILSESFRAGPIWHLGTRGPSCPEALHTREHSRWYKDILGVWVLMWSPGVLFVYLFLLFFAVLYYKSYFSSWSKQLLYLWHTFCLANVFSTLISRVDFIQVLPPPAAAMMGASGDRFITPARISFFALKLPK